MNCIFCNNQTIIYSCDDAPKTFHYCKYCSPTAYFISKENKLRSIFFYSSGEENGYGKFYRILLNLNENITRLQLVYMFPQDESYLVHHVKDLLVINHICNVTPSNFHYKLKTWLTFS